MKKWGWLGLVIGLMFVGYYFGSAYYAAYNLKSSAQSGDIDHIEAAVDFPSVRQNLKDQMSVALTQKIENDPKIKDNPFAEMGMMLMLAIIDRAVDTYVTPDGVAQLAQGETPVAEAEGEAEAQEEGAAATETAASVEYEYQWKGLNRFRVKTMNSETSEIGPELVFERRGIFAWKLIRIELPDTLFEEQ